MWLKEYIDYLEMKKDGTIKQQAEYAKGSYLYQQIELNIAMREFWIEACKSFTRGVR